MTAILRAEPNYSEMLICLIDLVELHGKNLTISLETWAKLEDLGLIDENEWKRKGFDVQRTWAILTLFYTESIATKPDVRSKDLEDSSKSSVVLISTEKLRQKSLVGGAR